MVTVGERAEGFGGLEVVSFESRRAAEMASIIHSFGGRPRVAPSMREIPLEANPDALLFGERLLAGSFQAVIFMTGVGTRYLMDVLEAQHARERLVAALAALTVVARGPKPVKALRELGVPVTITVPEPNTRRDILATLDAAPGGFLLKGSKVAVQEYGPGNAEFLDALRQRGAEVTRVPVYRWALPEDLEPLREAIRAVTATGVPILLFTSATQVDHVVQIAREMGEWERFREAAARGMIASIGPVCSDALREHGLPIHLEPEHPRMGHLVKAASERAAGLLGVGTEFNTETRRDGEGDTASKPQGDGATGRQGDPTTATAMTALALTESIPSVAPSPPRPVSPSVSPCLRVDAPLVRPTWQDSPFMRACRREPAPFTPVWLMRQAGRYMKEYRDLRERVPFLDLCKSPALVSEVTVTAAERIGADAAILFADILLIVEPMGLSLEYTRGEGPVISPPIRTSADVDRLREVDPAALDFVYQGVRQTRADLRPSTPLIGFAGAPFTLASYMIEGGASRTFEQTKGLMYRDPGAWHELMQRISRGLIHYLRGQIAAGAGAVQLFDSWVGCLSPEDYREFVLPHSRAVIEGVGRIAPVIHFGTGTATLLEDMVSAGGDVIGLDWRVELDRGWDVIGHDRGVQGNLDPVLLLADVPAIRERTARILSRAAGRPGHIFNLGHGILPQTPVEHVIALIDAVHELSEHAL